MPWRGTNLYSETTIQKLGSETKLADLDTKPPRNYTQRFKNYGLTALRLNLGYGSLVLRLWGFGMWGLSVVFRVSPWYS